MALILDYGKMDHIDFFNLFDIERPIGDISKLKIELRWTQ